jgi:hypothetical protein
MDDLNPEELDQMVELILQENFYRIETPEKRKEKSQSPELVRE